MKLWNPAINENFQLTSNDRHIDNQLDKSVQSIRVIIRAVINAYNLRQERRLNIYTIINTNS